jgi:hypothetical protein
VKNKMERMLEYLGNMIDAYDSGDAENVRRYGNELDASLAQCYPEGGAEKCAIDIMAQTIVLSLRESYRKVISDEDRDHVRYSYNAMNDCLEDPDMMKGALDNYNEIRAALE